MTLLHSTPAPVTGGSSDRDLFSYASLTIEDQV